MNLVTKNAATDIITSTKLVIGVIVSAIVIRLFRVQYATVTDLVNIVNSKSKRANHNHTSRNSGSSI